MVRGVGKTTQQMKDAPIGAVFIWCNGTLHYPKHLARDIGRGDLNIQSPEWLTMRRWQGMELTGIVLDHYLRLTSQQQESFQCALTRIST